MLFENLFKIASALCAYESPKQWAVEFVEKEGVGALKKLSRPWEWTLEFFH